MATTNTSLDENGTPSERNIEVGDRSKPYILRSLFSVCTFILRIDCLWLETLLEFVAACLRVVLPFVSTSRFMLSRYILLTNSRICWR